MLTLKILLYVMIVLFSIGTLTEKHKDIRIHFTSITIAAMFSLTLLYVAPFMWVLDTLYGR